MLVKATGNLLEWIITKFFIHKIKGEISLKSYGIKRVWRSLKASHLKQ